MTEGQNGQSFISTKLEMTGYLCLEKANASHISTEIFHRGYPQEFLVEKGKHRK